MYKKPPQIFCDVQRGLTLWHIMLTSLSRRQPITINYRVTGHQVSLNAGSKQLVHRQPSTSSWILYCGHSTQYSHLVNILLLTHKKTLGVAHLKRSYHFFIQQIIPWSSDTKLFVLAFHCRYSNDLTTTQPQKTTLQRCTRTKISRLQCFSLALHCVIIGFFSELLDKHLLQ